jgi:hypothetical protein
MHTPYPPVCRSCTFLASRLFRYQDRILRLSWHCSNGVPMEKIADDCAVHRPISASGIVGQRAVRAGGNLDWRKPQLDRRERMLVEVFLRRYAAWCARSRQADRVASALDLLSAIA